jgi:uncharacterized membrane protein
MATVEGVRESVDPEVAWLAATVAGLLAVVGGSLAFPRAVYDGFVWRHFLGRVVVDARNVRCAARVDGRTVLRDSVPASGTCADAFAAGAVVANGEYTPLSEVVYIGVLVFLLVGVVFLLRRLDVGTDLRFVWAMVPYMLFGSALRVVEDASNVAASAAGTTILPYPWNVLVIAPVIYVSGAVLTVAVLAAAVALARRGVVDDYARVTAAVGVVLFAVVAGFLAVLTVTADYVTFYPLVAVVTLVLATALAGGIYHALERYRPELVAGTGLVALLVIWAQAVDGVANVLVLDWAYVFGLQEYFPKHPVNRAIVAVTEATLPAGVTDAVGSAWPFLLVKLVVSVLVVSVFDERAFESSPRYAVLLLVTIVLVGLGPGARDMLRATLGV